MDIISNYCRTVKLLFCSNVLSKAGTFRSDHPTKTKVNAAGERQLVSAFLIDSSLQ